MLIGHRALVLVADGRRYLLLRNLGAPDRPVLAYEGGGEQENPATQAQGSDRPGRSISSVGHRRSAMQQTDFHRIEEERFAADVAAMLARLAQSEDFAELIVVAPPQTLAQLRRNYNRKLKERIVAEIDSDLTPLPVPKITAVLAAAPD